LTTIQAKLDTSQAEAKLLVQGYHVGRSRETQYAKPAKGKVERQQMRRGRKRTQQNEVQSPLTDGLKRLIMSSV
jgi:hypothetical protein